MSGEVSRMHLLRGRLGIIGFLAATGAGAVIGGPFGTATAEVVGSAPDMVEIEVVVEGPRGSPVVVHAVEPGGEQVTTALVERTPGVHSGRFEARPIDLVLVFEDVAAGQQGPPSTLTALGVEASALSPSSERVQSAGTAPQDVPEDDGSTARWGWLALALGLASLSLIAFWALPPASGRHRSDEAAPADPPEED